MFLPEAKPHLPPRRILGRPLDIPGGGVGPAEIHPDVRLQAALQPADVRAVHDAVAHGAEEAVEIGAAEIGAGAEFGERVLGGADAVEVDVGGGVNVHLLGEIGVDPQELRARARVSGRGLGLLLQAAEQRLEPFEARRVLADPDELDAAEAARRVRARAQVPDVLEDAGPGGDADAGADEHGDFVVEDVFRRGAVGSVDADARHGLVVLQRDFVDARRVEVVKFLGLCGTASKSVTDVAGPVAHLAHVDADVGVERAGGDGERVPLGRANRGDVDEKPLPGFVFHRWLLELNLHCVVGVTDDFCYFGWATRLDFTVDALAEVESSADQFPAPTFVADAVVPERGSGKRGVGVGRITDEAPSGVCVESQEERDEEVMCVPERLVRLLPDLGMGGREHQQHAQEHYVPSDATNLGIVYLYGGFLSDLRPLHIEETTIVSGDVEPVT